MGQPTPLTSDLYYDLVSIQYHALKGQDLYARFVEDARGHPAIAAFIEQVRDEDVRRARRCHELLTRLAVGDDPPVDAYPTESAPSNALGARLRNELGHTPAGP